MTTKDRIMQYLNFKGITQYVFSKKTGLANGFLKTGGSLSVENLKKISNVFDDLSVWWVISGEGDMIKKTEIGHKIQGNFNSVQNNPITINDTEKEALKEKIKSLEILLEAKEEIINLLKKKNK